MHTGKNSNVSKLFVVLVSITIICSLLKLILSPKAKLVLSLRYKQNKIFVDKILYGIMILALCDIIFYLLQQHEYVKNLWAKYINLLSRSLNVRYNKIDV